MSAIKKRKASFSLMPSTSHTAAPSPHSFSSPSSPSSSNVLPLGTVARKRPRRFRPRRLCDVQLVYDDRLYHLHSDVFVVHCGYFGQMPDEPSEWGIISLPSFKDVGDELVTRCFELVYRRQAIRLAVQMSSTIELTGMMRVATFLEFALLDTACTKELIKRVRAWSALSAKAEEELQLLWQMAVSVSRGWLVTALIDRFAAALRRDYAGTQHLLERVGVWEWLGQDPTRLKQLVQRICEPPPHVEHSDGESSGEEDEEDIRCLYTYDA